jgi:hypothetical protein
VSTVLSLVLPLALVAGLVCLAILVVKNPAAGAWEQRVRAATVWDALARRDVGGIRMEQPVAVWRCGGRVRRGGSVDRGRITVAADRNCILVASTKSHPPVRRLFVRGQPHELVHRRAALGPVLDERVSGVRLARCDTAAIAQGLRALGWDVREET